MVIYSRVNSDFVAYYIKEGHELFTRLFIRPTDFHTQKELGIDLSGSNARCLKMI